MVLKNYWKKITKFFSKTFKKSYENSGPLETNICKRKGQIKLIKNNFLLKLRKNTGDFGRITTWRININTLKYNDGQVKENDQKLKKKGNMIEKIFEEQVKIWLKLGVKCRKD